MKALVTGGGGFLGGAIVRGLLQRGDDVVSLSRGSYPALEALGVRCVQADLRDGDALRAAFAGRDAVFHCAAKPPPWGPAAEYDAVNITGTERVIDACRWAGVPVLVHTSTPSVVASNQDIEGGDESLPIATTHRSEYSRSKAQAEALVIGAHGEALRTVALRPHLVWGPGDPHFLPRFIARAASGRLRRIGRRDPLVDTTYVDNARDAHLLAADRLLADADVGGRPYFITNGEPIGCWTMVDRMLGAVGLPPIRRSVPIPVAMAAATLMEWAWRAFSLRGEPLVTRFLVQQVTHAHWFNLSAARDRLGYLPKVTLEDGLRRLGSGA